MKILIIINEKPGTDEKAYNAMRIAGQFQKENHQVFMYLIADGVFCSCTDVEMPEGILNVKEKVAGFIEKGGTLKMCTSCGESRGLMDKHLVKDAEWTNLKTLTDWVIECDKVINY